MENEKLIGPGPRLTKTEDCFKMSKRMSNLHFSAASIGVNFEKIMF